MFRHGLIFLCEAGIGSTRSETELDVRRASSPSFRRCCRARAIYKRRVPRERQCRRFDRLVSMSSAGEGNVYGAYDDLTRNSRVTTSRADSSSSASPPSCSLHHHHHHLGGFLGASTTAELSDDELGDLPSCAYAGRNTGSGVQQLQYLGVSGQYTYVGLGASLT